MYLLSSQVPKKVHKSTGVRTEKPSCGSMEITNINQLDVTNGLYTYADYLLWKFEERLELIKGKIFKMSPAPAITHQRVSRKLSGELYNFFKGKTCELFTAPFDVILPNANGKEDTVVQPDLCVVHRLK